MATEKLSGVKGWGADKDPKDRPAYPKERIPARDIGVHWDHPVQQRQSVRILQSSERPGITPIFGTTCPPRGVSGRLREMAFSRTENDILHWLTLLFADRVDMVEGVIEDFRSGHIPNVWKEMGGPAELKYNRGGFIKKVAFTGAVIGAAYLLLRKPSR